MEPAVPPWLNEVFLSSALQGEGEGEAGRPSVTVVSFSAKPAVTAGNNYTSFVFRVAVEYTEGTSEELQKTSLIVKAPIETGIVQEMNKQMNFFQREPKFYKDLLSRLSGKAQVNFGPEVYYCPKPDGMVFNDLSTEGYTLCDRQKQLDYSHCKLVVETLARFHAASVACHREDPTLIETTGEEPVFVEGGLMTEQFKSLMPLCTQIFVEVLKSLGETQDTIEMFFKESSNRWNALLDLFKPRKNSLNVLNHGDCWTSNLLFKHDGSGKVTDVKLIDFQALRYMSPAIDLIYFIWSSANEDVRDNNIANLYESYRKTLNQTLESNDCKERLSHEELEEHLKLASPWVLMMVSSTAPMLINEPENVMNSAEMDMDSFSPAVMIEWYKKMYSGKTYQSLLPGYIRQLKRWYDIYG